MIQNIIHKIQAPIFQICVTGNDPLQIQDLKEELSLRFRNKININIFKSETECFHMINKKIDIAFFVGITPIDDDYSEEIKIRKKIRLISPLTDVFILPNEAQKIEALSFLYDLTQLNEFFGLCRLAWKHWTVAPIKDILNMFKRTPVVRHGIQDKPVVVKKLEVSI